MLAYSKGWNQQPYFMVPVVYQPQTKISIIIPARNEAANIRQCLQSILRQNYPSHLFEVIVVDDNSEDNTAAIVKAFPNVKYLLLNDADRAHKKKALALGISNSNGELIVTTDADCIVPSDWLKTIAAKYEATDPVMIIAPVIFNTNNSLLEIFQSIDFMTMQGITAAAHQLRMGNMSNGANLAFSSDAFQAVNGYEGIDHLASGDDYLLMMKLQHKFPNRIAYIKSKAAIVETAPQKSWKDFFNQRIRWASKSGKYDDRTLTTILVLVYLFNLSFLALAAAAIFNNFYWEVLLLMLTSKIFIELYFLFPVASFFHKKRQLWIFPFLQPLHILYIITAGFLGFFGVYSWKGRITK